MSEFPFECKSRLRGLPRIPPTAVISLLVLSYLLPLAEPSFGEAAATSFRVACMRVKPRPWETAHNFQLLERYARQAAEEGAQLVVTCEGFLTGYINNPKWAPRFSRERYFEHGESLNGRWLKRVAELAAALQIYVAIGFAERDGQQMHNSVAVYSPQGELELHYSKTHTSGEPFSTPGDDFPVAHTELGNFGALICYDRRFPEVARILSLKGAQFLILPAYGNDGERNEALLRTRAWENSVWVIYVKQNQALVIQPNGKIVARDAGKGDELVMATIDIDENVGTGDILQRRPAEIYREILEVKKTAETKE